MTNRILLSEVLRPTTFGDLALPNRTVRQFQAMLESGNVMNLLLHGKPGTGKTSTAKIFENGDFDVLFINGSLENGIDVVREQIHPFAISGSLFDSPKIVIIDESEFLSDSAQASLRSLIEVVSRNCRFIFTANDPHKLSSALQSRLQPVKFQTTIEDKPEIIERLTSCITNKLAAVGKMVEPEFVRDTISESYPDLRKVANILQFHLS